MQTAAPRVSLWDGTAITPTETLRYDGDGNRFYDQDPSGAVTADSYDPLGRQVSETNPVSGTLVLTYTATRKAADQDPGGDVTRYTYNSVGEVIQVVDPVSGTVQYAYDGVGNSTTITTSDGTAVNAVETRGYDGLNQEVASTVTVPGSGTALTTRTAYDLDGNVARVQQPDGSLAYQKQSGEVPGPWPLHDLRSRPLIH